jgi:hypothetical protein
VHVLEEEEFTFEIKTNNKSTGEAQSANYLKSRTDYTTSQCQSVNAKLEKKNLRLKLENKPRTQSCAEQKKNLRLKTNNKSTGEAQSANYLKRRRTDHYTTKCQLVNAKLENDELKPA